MPHLRYKTENEAGNVFSHHSSKPSLLRKWTRRQKQPSEKSHPKPALPWKAELLWLAINYLEFSRIHIVLKNYTEKNLLEVWNLDPLQYCVTCSNFLHSKSIWLYRDHNHLSSNLRSNGSKHKQTYCLPRKTSETLKKNHFSFNFIFQLKTPFSSWLVYWLDQQ